MVCDFSLFLSFTFSDCFLSCFLFFSFCFIACLCFICPFFYLTRPCVRERDENELDYVRVVRLREGKSLREFESVWELGGVRLGVGGGGRLSGWVCERRCGREREKRGREKQKQCPLLPDLSSWFRVIFLSFFHISSYFYAFLFTSLYTPCDK